MTPTHPTNPDRKPPKCSKFKNHFNGGGENCIYCGACRSCGKIGHKYQKCPRFESPKPAQLAEEKGCSNCGACEAGSHLSPCDQEIEEPFPQSPLTQEDRELLDYYETFGLADFAGDDFTSIAIHVSKLMSAKSREADEMVRLERERCLKIVSRIQCPCESKCSHFNYVRDSAREQILNPESPESNK